MPQNQVAEVQGLYGPFTLSERVIQKIWLQQDFAAENMKTVSGGELIIKDPGRWNFFEGPDFKEAKLILNGVEVIGDVEIHINFLDWRHHRHENDTNYDKVLLHVVLYLDKSDHLSQMQTSKGHSPEVLYLMPLLEKDLESYAMEDALLKLEQQDELTWVRQFIEQPLEKRVQILEQHATVRWRQKLAYAQQRLKTEGWESACHSYALEVFGYARNRAPMLRLAARHPLVQMRKTLFEHRTLNSEHRILNTESEKKSFNADRLFDEESGNWKLNGLRPANHPRRRLAQYLEIVVKQPRWPGRLADCLQSFPVVLASNRTASFRKAVDLSELRRNLSESVFGSVISEKRFNTLIVDAILPLATNAGLLNGLDYWLHWFPGDSPEALYRFLKHAGVTSRQSPQSNSLIQGALGLFLDQQG